MSRKRLHLLRADRIEHWRDGRLIWTAEDLLNTVTDEGEAWFLDVALRNTQTDLTGFEVILSTSNTLAETSVYADRSELADGNGYAGVAVARSTAGFDAPSGTNPTTTKVSTNPSWTATGDWPATVYNACLVTVGAATNRLLAFIPIGGTGGRTILNGDTLTVTFNVAAGGS